MECSYCTRKVRKDRGSAHRTIDCEQCSSYLTHHSKEAKVAGNGKFVLHLCSRPAHGDYIYCPGYKTLNNEFISWRDAQLKGAQERPRSRGSEATILAHSAPGKRSHGLGPALDWTGVDEGQLFPRIAFIFRYEQQLLGRSPNWQLNQTFSIDPSRLMSLITGEGVDRQNVPLAQALVGNRELLQQLSEDGHEEEALVLLVISLSFEAMQCEGLTVEERSSRLQLRTKLLHRIVGNQSFRPNGLSGKPGGLTKELLLSWQYNADTRLQVLGNHIGTVLDGLLNERSLSSDCVELVFAMVVMICGYKPPQATLMGSSRAIEFAMRARSMPKADCLFSIKRSPKHTYALYPHARDPLMWGQPSTSMDENAGARVHQLIGLSASSTKEAHRKTQHRSETIRSYHVKGAE